MKYTETGFRAVYHRFAVFPLTEVTRGAIEGLPGEKTAEGNVNETQLGRTGCLCSQIDRNILS